MLLKYSLLLICLCVIPYVRSSTDRSPCSYKMNVTSHYIEGYCTKINGVLTHGCCRIMANNTFAAVDLSDANLTNIPRFSFGNFESSVIVIDLRLNENLQLLKEDFMNLTNLYDLYLPANMTCPGGIDAWAKIEEAEDGVHCEQQRDLCLTLANPCPPNVAVCSPNGPNQISCLCKQGRKGYKCLRSGDFPYIAFIIPTGVATLLASALLFWTHRRHVKT